MGSVPGKGARRMRHGEAGKQAVSYETYKKTAPHEMIATSAEGKQVMMT